MNKMNPFTALTDIRPLIFLSNLSNIDELALVVNIGKISLAKRTARFIRTSLPNLPFILPRNPPATRLNFFKTNELY